MRLRHDAATLSSTVSSRMQNASAPGVGRYRWSGHCSHDTRLSRTRLVRHDGVAPTQRAFECGHDTIGIDLAR